ncbi:MAG TPA: hypothetical protein VHV81_00060 [Steroidobacteraceae bacterium]|jgi:hypothetical protein|nr:hypothetical protein [Steroidobacteraceae bacterium]
MRRRDVSRALLVSAAGAALPGTQAEAQGSAAVLYPQTAAEAAAGVKPLTTSLPPGQVDRYFANAVPGSTPANAAFASAIAQARRISNGVPIGAPVIVNGPVAIAAAGGAVTIPGASADAPAVLLQILSGSISLERGALLQINGSFSAPRASCFRGAGLVAFGGGNTGGQGAVLELYPEWWGARADSHAAEHGGIGTAGTDCTAAIASCLIAAAGGAADGGGLVPIRFGPGYYRTGQQRIPPVSALFGSGREQSGFIAKAGTSGAWWQEVPAGAAKIIIQDLAFYCAYAASPRMTHGLKLGYENVASPHGTEGYLKSLWIRDCACFENGFQCDVKGNVGFYDLLSIYCNGQPQQSGLRITGTGNRCSNIVSMAPGAYGLYLNGIGIQVTGLEIEAPSSGAIPLSIQQNADISGVLFALADDTEIDHVWEVGRNAASWRLAGAQYVWGSKRSARVLRGNGMRADGSYFAGNATGQGHHAAVAPHGGDGLWESESAGQRLQSFTLRIRNDSGMLQHRIGEPGGGDTRFASTINAASAAFVRTPAGADATTPFAAGGKIGGSQTNVFWLDTADQSAADTLGVAFVSYNSTGVVLNVVAGVAAASIVGTSRNRLYFQFTNAATGAPFALDTAHIASGVVLQVSWLGHLSN